VIHSGVSIASRYLELLADVKPPRVVVYAYTQQSNLDVPWEGIANATGNSAEIIEEDLGLFVGQAFPASIFINTGAPQWQELNALHQLRLAAHEYFHAVQMDLMGPTIARQFYTSPVNEVTPAGPNWLIEGSAEYISWRAMQAAGLLNLDRFMTESTPPHVAISDLETFLGFYTHGQQSYDASLAAVYALVRESGDAALVNYYRYVGRGASWRTAFVIIFGQTPERFYEDYK
jgi:hypothetical protein